MFSENTFFRATEQTDHTLTNYDRGEIFIHLAFSCGDFSVENAGIDHFDHPKLPGR